MRIVQLLVLLPLFFVIPSQLAAKTIQANASGNWNDGSTWKGGKVPTSSDDVEINGFQVTLNGNYTIKSLSIDDDNVLNPSSLTIAFGSSITCTGLVELKTDEGAGSSGTVLNVFGTLNANGGISINNQSSQVVGLILGSTNTINIGSNNFGGTINTTSFSAINVNTLLGNPADVNIVNLRNGVLAINGEFSLGDASAPLNAFYNKLYLDDSGIYAGLQKQIRYAGQNGLGISQGAISGISVTENSNYQFVYTGDLEQDFLVDNVLYTHVIVDKTGGTLNIENNLPSASFLNSITVKGGSSVTFYKSDANFDALEEANSFIVEANGRIIITGEAFATALPSKSVCNFDQQAIVEYSVPSAEASGEIFKESFDYPQVELTGMGTKLYSASSQNVNGAGTTVRNISLIEGTWSIAGGKSLKLIDEVGSGGISLEASTTLDLLGDFQDIQAHWNIDRENTFRYAGVSPQVVYDLYDENGDKMPYGILAFVSPGESVVRVVEPNKNIWIANELRLGDLTTTQLEDNALITLKSDINFTAFVAPVAPTAEIIYGSNAAFEVEKYLPLPYVAYRDVSSPIKNTKLSSWQNAGIRLVGFPGSVNPNAVRVSATRYDETVQGNLNIGFYNATDISNPIFEFGAGNVIEKSVFRVLDGNNANLDYFVTLKDRGELRTGEQNFKITYSITEGEQTQFKKANDGWNQLGNPYAAPLDWDLVVNDPENISWVQSNVLDPTVYIIAQVDRFQNDPNNPGYYGFYNSATGFSIVHDDIIPSYQGFWVKTYENNKQNVEFTLKVKEEHKATLQNSRYYKSNKNNLRAKNAINPDEDAVAMTIMQEGKGREKVWFHYWPGAKVGADTLYDVSKFGQPSPNAVAIDFVENGDPMNVWVNALPEKASRYEMPIYVQAPRPGNYAVSFSNLHVFTDRFPCAYLLDVVTGKTMDLAVDTLYEFTVTDSYVGNRFLMYFNQNIASKISKENAACFAEKGKMIFDLSDIDGEIDYSVNNVQTGQFIDQIKGQNLGVVTREYPAGQYLVRNNKGLLTCYSNTLRIDINQPLQVSADFTADNFNVEVGSPVSFTNQSSNGLTYVWNFDDGQISTEKNPVHIFETPGTFLVSLLTRGNNPECADEVSKEVTVAFTTGIAEFNNTKLSFSSTNGLLQVNGFQDMGPCAITIYNLTGQQLYRDDNYTGKSIQLNKNQVIIVKVQSDKGLWTYKLAL
ncbi:PKD domain-containing protein [Luteibaculum oceani]|uniref:PKD domain-containing protein n=1 Tax=Luteibaculum oceani TaxID=1294296 RepID=A0A5C6V815_9FLAO|nr:PKD domain-containing protein [Luteibaculum oceani]TXC81433.1 PKD domain-containing protein [Luteibaculum oceani]